MPVGAKMVSIGIGRFLAFGTKGNAILEIVPADPLPAGIIVGAPDVEIRKSHSRESREPTSDYTVFEQTDHQPGDTLTKLVVFIKLFRSVDDRLAACGFYLREPTRPDIGSGDRFSDLRSYIEIGSLARLPTNFLGDATPSYVGEVPGPMETILDRPADSARIRPTCVNSTIQWNPAFAKAPLALHLPFPAFRYTLKIKSSYLRPVQ